jgi:hypothetical protein
MGAGDLDDAIDELKDSVKNVRYRKVHVICETFFGPCRKRGSHRIFPTPWKGAPFVNLQELPGGRVKLYQVKQVISALEVLREVKNES